jgi:hypothetical protein
MRAMAVHVPLLLISLNTAREKFVVMVKTYISVLMRFRCQEPEHHSMLVIFYHLL